MPAAVRHQYFPWAIYKTRVRSRGDTPPSLLLHFSERTSRGTYGAARRSPGVRRWSPGCTDFLGGAHEQPQVAGQSANSYAIKPAAARVAGTPPPLISPERLCSTGFFHTVRRTTSSFGRTVSTLRGSRNYGFARLIAIFCRLLTSPRLPLWRRRPWQTRHIRIVGPCRGTGTGAVCGGHQPCGMQFRSFGAPNLRPAR